MPDTSAHPLRNALSKFWAPVPWLLEASTVLQIFLHKYFEASVIAGLLVFNAALAYFQEGMREISQAEVTDDGILFDPSSFAGEVIREDADYAGVRTAFVGRVDSARVHMQIDIGFGDVMTPGPETLTYPTILDFPAPTLSGYSRETVVAEKLQALVQLRMLNTRMKDYFDLWLLTRQPELSRDVLVEAIKRTFANRGMQLDLDPIGLSSAFGNEINFYFQILGNPWGQPKAYLLATTALFLGEGCRWVQKTAFLL